MKKSLDKYMKDHILDRNVHVWDYLLEIKN